MQVRRCAWEKGGGGCIQDVCIRSRKVVNRIQGMYNSKIGCKMIKTLLPDSATIRTS
jgi:hypothetical protein